MARRRISIDQTLLPLSPTLSESAATTPLLGGGRGRGATDDAPDVLHASYPYSSGSTSSSASSTDDHDYHVGVMSTAAHASLYHQRRTSAPAKCSPSAVAEQRRSTSWTRVLFSSSAAASSSSSSASSSISATATTIGAPAQPSRHHHGQSFFALQQDGVTSNAPSVATSLVRALHLVTSSRALPWIATVLLATYAIWQECVAGTELSLRLAQLAGTASTATSRTQWTSQPTSSLFRSASNTRTQCDASQTLELRKTADFWKVEIDSEASQIHVTPRRPDVYANCPELANAYFTGKVVYADEIRLLNEPAQPEMGHYVFEMLAPLQEQSSEMGAVDMSLDMDFFPGGRQGMPCGQLECNYTSLMSSGMDWIGDQIKDGNGRVPTFNVSTRTHVATNTNAAWPVCTSFNDLMGSWRPEDAIFTFTSPATGEPCRMLAIAPLEGPKRRWIRFLGDSNSRKLLPEYARLLNASNILAYKPDTDAHPTVLMAWNDNVILTFSWWFMRQGVTSDEVQDEEQLDGLLAYSLNDFLESVPWDRTKPWPSHFENFAEPAHRIYLSIGSHAPQATSLGVTTLLEKIRPLLESIANSSKVVLTLTASASPDRLPKLYIPTKVLRNNIMLKATNQVIAEFGRTMGLTVLDLFTMTRTMGTKMASDPVHFKQRVYELWAEIYYTEWMSSL
ncbi:hypothetical protein OIO90_005494 [Microbotryomycetes sp. JL221]|nr:hypothetical protein OIO90_005494 [Microbotryomycetes sp. JL221]